jgi:hypothetical protein
MKLKQIILVFALFGTLACNSKHIYYISPDGNDRNDGTKSAPFASLAKALEVIRTSHVNESSEGYKVVLKGGRYILENTVHIDQSVTGQIGKELEIVAAEGEEVIISGGRYFKKAELKLPGENELKRLIDQEARKHVKVLDLKAKGITNYGEIKHVGFCRPILAAGMELFQGDKNMTLTSFPSEGYIKIGKVIDSGSKPRNDDFSDRGGVFTYDVSRPSRWKANDDLWVQGMFGTVWADDKLKVASIDTLKKIIATQEPHLYGISGGHFRFMNIIEELNKPGSYFIDRENGKVYIYPAEGEEDISITMLETPLLALVGASNVLFKNITFENGRGIGAYIEGGTDNIFLNCTFRNFGSYGVSLGKGTKPFEFLAHEGIGEPWPGNIGSLRQHIYSDITYNRQAGENNGLVSCKIYNTGAGGVSLGGGDIKSLTSANNYVDSCEIFHTGLRYQTYAPCIDITGVGNRVSNCKIYDSPHSGIIYYGNEHVIENNEIYDVLLESDDGGAIYTGRDVTSIGTVIRNNYIHHVGSKNPFYHHGYWHGIYLDDYAGEVIIENNLFKDILAGVLVSGRNITCRNNILINCDRPIIIQHRPWMGIQDRRLKQVGAFGSVWKERYPQIQKIQQETNEEKGKYWETKSFGNVSFGSENPCTILDRIDSSYVLIERNLDYPLEKLNEFFVDSERNNFHLKDSSMLLQKLTGLEKMK